MLYNTQLLIDVRERLTNLEKVVMTDRAKTDLNTPGFSFTPIANEDGYNEFCENLKGEKFRSNMVC